MEGLRIIRTQIVKADLDAAVSTRKDVPPEFYEAAELYFK